MSPSNSEKRNDVTKGAINGPQSSSFRIKKDSHTILKPSSSSQSLSPASSSKQKSAAPKRQPLIIYTHSPKIIHAQARDFMTLVQKLTGFTRSGEDQEKTRFKIEPDPGKVLEGGVNVVYEDKKSCSDIPKLMEFEKRSSWSENSPANQFLPAAMTADHFQLFTSTAHLFYETPNFDDSISPHVFTMNGFGEY